MSRVELVAAAQAPMLARRWYAEDGSASALTRALAQVPELLDVALPFIGVLYDEGSVDLRTKELVILRVSAVNRCRYCVATHTPAAREAGLTETEIEVLRGTGDGLAARDAALVEWCDAVARAADPVADDLVSRLREHFAEHQIVELTLVAGATVMLNRFCTALDLAPA